MRAEQSWQGIRFIQGLLTGSPSKALRLDEYSEELYSDDHSGPAIEDLTPDYSILDQIEYKYPVRDAYFAYASRGCIRKCTFCGVPKLEGEQRDAESITSVVRNIEALLRPEERSDPDGQQRRREPALPRNYCGNPGPWVPAGRETDYGASPDPAPRGLQSRRGCAHPVQGSLYLRDLSRICLKPLRIAFDHLGLKGPYEQAVRYAHEFGLSSMSNYMLYNFHDSPADLFERMRLNVTLNEELDICASGPSPCAISPPTCRTVRTSARSGRATSLRQCRSSCKRPMGL